MILKYSVHLLPRVAETILRGPRVALGLDDVRTWRDYYLELERRPSPAAEELLRQALGDPRTEEVREGEPLVPGEMVQVAYLRGIVDNENDSLLTLCELLGVPARAARVATTYRSADPELAERVRRVFVNPNIEELHLHEPAYATLRPAGEARAPERCDLRALDDDGLAAVGSDGGRNLDLDKMRRLQAIQLALGEESITDVLVEALDARWSDHCMHTTWKSLGDLLGRLAAASRRTGNPNILSMFEDNAGVWDFYDGWAVAVKAETHSGPSAVSAYFGQLTKVGGVLRDILGTGLGADPIAIFEYTATGVPGEPAPLPGRPSPQQIAHETVRAVREYGNTFGVPMMGSHMTFHRAYRAKPFALGGSLGLLPATAAGRRAPQAGDVLVLIGGLTGNDGIHGASASSAGAEMDHAAVQIGSPLEQVKFRQAILDLRDGGCLRALTDVGGAGLNSAAGELGDPGGVWLNTALVPLKTSALPTWRILLSESQERMILAVPPDRHGEAVAVLERHAVRHTAIGRFTGDGRYTVVHAPDVGEPDVLGADVEHLPGDPATGFSVPYDALDYEPPQRHATAPAGPTAGGAGGSGGAGETGGRSGSGRAAGEIGWPRLDVDGLRGTLAGMLADPELASQRWASAQYDTTVQGHTVYGPTAGDAHVPTSFWAGSPLADSPAAVVASVAFDPWLFTVDPRLATRQMFMRALATQVLAGVAPGDVCLCDNFYTPHLEPDADGWLVAMVDELCALMDALGAPLISGKDSSAGSVQTPEGIVSVPPAVFLSAVGKVPDRAGLRRNEWTAPGNVLVRIGPDTPSPAATVAGRVLGLEPGGLDAPSPEDFREHLAALSELGNDTAPSGRPIGGGGTLACVALGAIASGLGVELEDPGDEDLHTLLHEHRCGAIVEVPEAALDTVSPALRPRVVGRVTAAPASVRVRGEELLGEAAVATWRTAWTERLG